MNVYDAILGDHHPDEMGSGHQRLGIWPIPVRGGQPEVDIGHVLVEAILTFNLEIYVHGNTERRQLEPIARLRPRTDVQMVGDLVVAERLF